MKFYKSITFKLFLLLFLLLTTFISAVIIIQVYVIGRSYSISEYTIERNQEIMPLLSGFEYNLYYDVFSNGYNYTSKASRLTYIKEFEAQNEINLIVVDKNFNVELITRNTRKTLGKNCIDYIKKELKTASRPMDPLNNSNRGGLMAPFRIYNKYSVPTKYIVFTQFEHLPNIGMKYFVTVIPEVFTSKSSRVLTGYVKYLFLFLLILIIIVSIVIAYIVAKPILEINRTASKIAELDFSEKCNVKSENEIGSLAKTINAMSNNLEDTLDSLSQANKKLHKDLDLQKELDMMRRQFLADVTHELKTPITLIKGYTESIVDDVAQGEERETALKTIIEQTENMDKLVKELLDLSRLESIGYTLNISEFYADELIDRICSKYKNIINNRNIELNNSIPANILVKGDKFRIEQVLSNFINNAIDNTPPQKSATISVEVSCGKALISVHNEGKNIDEAEIDKIWEKFYRIEKSRNKKLGGTGLGLAISKSILELHKSSYGVTNTEDGVTFFFSLELVDA